ncbi:MAG: pantetheine-phosphate adenylyltransferase [Eubacteriales bacterium]
MTEKKYRLGIVPGSFDPITCGHADIVGRALEICDSVVVAVMINPDKKYMFSIDERRRIAEAALAGKRGVRVISSEGMLWRLARELGADAIVKGVRNEDDRKYELEMARFNSEHFPSAVTVLLEAHGGLCTVSSTAVREKIKKHEELNGTVPDGAVGIIEEILKERSKEET